MSETKSNGPVGDRIASAADPGHQVDLRTECDRLREQVQKLSAERDGLQERMALLERREEAESNGIIRFVRDAVVEAPTWTPPPENECDRLRTHVREVSAERDTLRESVARLKSDYKDTLRSLFDYLKEDNGEEKPWPEDERDCLDFRQFVDEAEREFTDSRHAGQR